MIARKHRMMLDMEQIKELNVYPLLCLMGSSEENKINLGLVSSERKLSPEGTEIHLACLIISPKDGTCHFRGR